MPREGSSIMKILALAITHFPMTTFCWLPPERLVMRCLTSATFTCISATVFFTASRQRLLSIMPLRVK